MTTPRKIFPALIASSFLLAGCLGASADEPMSEKELKQAEKHVMAMLQTQR